MLRRAVILLIICLPMAVTAREAMIGGVPINLPPPPGYCEMDAVKASDAQMLTTVGNLLGASGNRLVLASAECKQLKDWRAGKRTLIDNMAQYQTLVSLENAELPAAPEAAIKELCDQMRAQADQLMDDVADNLKRRAEEAMQDVKFDATEFLGVVAQEPFACYAALLQKLKTEGGADRAQVTVFATTVIKNKIVYAYLFAPYVSGDTVTAMLALQKANVDRLQKANVDKRLKVAPAPPPKAKAAKAK